MITQLALLTPTDQAQAPSGCSALVVNLRRGPYEVYIGRGRGPRGEAGIFGNPWSHKRETLATFQVSTRDEAIAAYRSWLTCASGYEAVLPQRRAAILAALPQLRGKVLGCFCKPLSCHGDALAEMANA